MTIRDYILEQDKQLFKSKWHDIKITDDGFEYNSGIPGVAILPYRNLPHLKGESIKREFLLRKERNPQQPDKPATVVTGRKDKSGENNLQTAIRELKEETGYLASASRFKEYGEVYIGKESPISDVFFSVNLTGIPLGEIITDGTDDEKMSSNFWVSFPDLKNYVKNSKCVYLNTAVSFLMNDLYPDTSV